MKRILLAFALFCAAPAAAQDVPTATPGSTPPAASIDDIAWLGGHWEGEGLGGQSIETISPPVAGQMVGHFQQVKDGKLQFYEIYHFVPHGNSLLMRIKHFNPDLTGWEEKGETVDFPLVAIEKDAVYFDGLTMRKTADGGLESFVVIEDQGNRVASFRFRRVSP